MWVRLWIAFSVSASVLSQTNNRVYQSGAGFEWSWLGGAGLGTVGQYYVKLPQSEQRVVYAADGSGYHGAAALNTTDAHSSHTQTFALGQKALELNAQQEQEKSLLNQQNPAQKNSQPVDIFLLQQLSPQFELNNPNLHQNNYYNNPRPLYNFDTEPSNDDRSEPLGKEAKFEQKISPVQIFKDHNCTDDKDIESDLNKSQNLFSEVTNWRDINGNFGAKTKPNKNTNYKENTDRSEKIYFTEFNENATQEGINRLVASTQDLISNEDLLKINNAIEQHLREHGDDLIKPRNKNYESLETSPTMITVQAKISNILKGMDSVRNDEVLQADSNGYRFSTPIIVADTPKNVGSQIFDNVVTTVVPYLDNGYKFVGINNNQYKDNSEYNDNSEENLVSVTPRPIGINYLAPLTVALRLINSNNDTFQDDHEGADSEFVNAIAKPKHKTVVEVQKSIPLDITHINEVEVHEYLDEGRANSENYNLAKNLYDKLSSSLQLKDNLNKILHKYKDMNDENNEQNHNGDSKEQLEVSENIQSPVQIPIDDYQRDDLYNYYENTNQNHEGQQIIQPIIIEKQIPVTKFVDRYIEKQVPYPEAVAVPIPVDRPVPYAVEVEKVVEKPVEVTKYVNKPYPVQVPYPVEVKVPYPVHQKIYVDRPVHIGYPVEKIVEKNVVHPIPVPTPYGVPVEVPYPVEHKVLYPYPVDRPVPVPIEVERPVEKVIQKEVPVPYPVEKRVPYPVHYETKVPVPYPVEKQVPVEKIVEKPVTQVVERPVHIKVPVPHPVPIHVHHPYPVEKIVEKKVPYPVPVDRIVEKKVPIQVPYPVEKIVEKIVERPVVVTKYVDKPYAVEKLVPYPVEVRVPQDDLRVAYRYKQIQEESKHHPQYQSIDQSDLKNMQLNNWKAQYEQYARQTQRDIKQQQLRTQYDEYVKNLNISQTKSQFSGGQYDEYANANSLNKPQNRPQLLESTHFGNHYASSYQYINNTGSYNPNVQRNYINHFTHSNSQNRKPTQIQEPNHNQYASQSQSQYTGQNQNQYAGQSQNQYASQNQNQYASQNQNQYPSQNQNQYASQNQNQYAAQSQNSWDKNKAKYGQIYEQYLGLYQNKNKHGQNDLYASQSKKNYQYGQNYPLYSQQHKSYQYGVTDQYASQSQNYWGKNNYSDDKVRRTDRVPKVTIEYGFKPPLIPSTEVDLDGLPVNKSE